MNIKSKLKQFLENRARKKHLKKEINKLKSSEKPSSNKETDKTIAQNFHDSLLATEKMVAYCRKKQLKTKSDWKKAGVPMNDVVKELLNNSKKYSELKMREAKQSSKKSENLYNSYGGE